jgi:hypothetical protein
MVEYAMVQAIENRSDVEGRIVAIKAAKADPEHRLVTIAVGAVTAVEGYPNLFASTSGSSIDVILPAHLATPLKVGGMVRCRIRRTGPTAVFAESCKPRER